MKTLQNVFFFSFFFTKYINCKYGRYLVSRKEGGRDWYPSFMTAFGFNLLLNTERNSYAFPSPIRAYRNWRKTVCLPCTTQEKKSWQRVVFSLFIFFFFSLPYFHTGDRDSSEKYKSLNAFDGNGINKSSSSKSIETLSLLVYIIYRLEYPSNRESSSSIRRILPNYIYRGKMLPIIFERQYKMEAIFSFGVINEDKLCVSNSAGSKYLIALVARRATLGQQSKPSN